ncbi:zinc ribbon domain-containing protein [Haloarchaeobius sp. HRN-SO-5]|uniref:zinc ribbon domain-containing protein n=1 Tax=Haloarchaeobius sp. HRN-SO-5 TaxID=3446118 RepID=UPI003EBDC5DC
MDYSDRRFRHVLLPVAELVALPASIVATAVVLFAGAVALHLVRFVGALVLVGSGVSHFLFGVSFPVVTVWNDFVEWAVVLATLVALLSLGALVVVLYWRAFESWGTFRPEVAVLVPVLGLVPAVYGLLTTGTVSLPWWPFALTALWVHALAYRTLAVEGLLSVDRRVSMAVGSVVAIPAIGAEALFIGDTVAPLGVLSVPGHTGTHEVVQETVTAVSTAGIALDRPLLVVAPLTVTLVFGLRRAYYARETVRRRVRVVSARARGLLRRPSFGGLPSLPFRSKSSSDSSEPWIPTSPSPGAGPKRRPDRRGASMDDSGDGDSSRARDEDTDEPFSNTQIFTGSFDGDDAGDTCPNCGGTIDTSDRVGFCPHCGAER